PREVSYDQALPRTVHPLDPHPLVARGAPHSVRARDGAVQTAAPFVRAGHADGEVSRHRGRRLGLVRVGRDPRVLDREVRRGATGAAAGGRGVGALTLRGPPSGEPQPPPLCGDFARHTMFLPEAERIPQVAADARVRAKNALDVLERRLASKEYLVGNELSGADIMMGYFLMAARMVGVIGAEHPNVSAYWERLAARPGFQKALSA